jgi:succinate dehydrogenase / fumarate reductase cytochrome b subunit
MATEPAEASRILEQAPGVVPDVRPERASYLLDKLHSLSGIIPIGAFLAEHFWANSYALVSAQRYDAVSVELQTIPWRVAVEALAIWIPILFHGFYGLYIWTQGKSNQFRYGWFENWMYVLQRWSGIVTFVFIGWHVYWERFLTGGKSTYGDLAHTMANPMFFAFYIVGITAASFHFGNGLWQFANKWGIAVSPQAQRATGILCGLIGAIFMAVGLLIAIAFHLQWQPFMHYAQ